MPRLPLINNPPSFESFFKKSHSFRVPSSCSLVFCCEKCCNRLGGWPLSSWMSLSLVVVSFFVLRLAYICLVCLAIAGLSTAIGLALSGHTVRVLEKSPRLEEPTGGIRLPPNVTRILVEWGLEEEIRKSASHVCEGSNLWDCKLFAVT
jgi:hypothetical protein